MVVRVWVAVVLAVLACSACGGGSSKEAAGRQPAAMVAADGAAPVQPVAAQAWHVPARPRGAGAYLMARLRRPLHTRFGIVHTKTQFGGPVWVPILSHRGAQAALLVPLRPYGRVVHADVRSLALRWSRIHVVINLATSRLVIFRGRRAVGAFPVGQGTALTPTPTGRFFVTDRLLFPSGSPYAPYAVGLSAHVAQLPSSWMGGDQVAIHPGAFGAVSHGCIHAGMKAIRLLERRVGMGTLVTIKA